MKKRLIRKGFLWASLALFVAALAVPAGEAGAQQAELQRIANASSIAELKAVYAESGNAIVRSRALQAVSGVIRKSGISRVDEQVIEFLNLGLQDRGLPVVEEAIRHVGQLRLVEFSERLIDLFYAVDERFPGSQEEVQFQIIAAFGKIGGQDARMLFREILEEGIVSQRTNKVLDAVRESNDASMAPWVAGYAAKLEKQLSEVRDLAPNDPRYIRMKNALDLARRVEKSLSE